MKIRWRKSLVVELAAAEVIEACRTYVVANSNLMVGGKKADLLTADGFDDHDRTFTLTFEEKE